MSSLVKNDGIADDGENSRTDYDYGEGHYDRYERGIFSFKKVTALTISTISLIVKQLTNIIMKIISSLSNYQKVGRERGRK